MDYQKTLNLPQTDFAMKANLAQREPLFLQKWNEQKLWDKIKAKSKGKKQFILHDGPPYANGNIHIGHALNKILKDFIVKYKTMQDLDSFYLPGWDCHGLPIEHQLLKDLKKKKNDVEVISFRKEAHDYAMKYVGIQRDQFKRLGVFGEWDHPYLTLSPDYEYWILKSLENLQKKGYVYRGLKPVNWCFSCETALAEAEVEYEDHVSPTVFVKFEVDPSGCHFEEPKKGDEAISNKIASRPSSARNDTVLSGLPNKKLSLVIWTTTPWTLLANVAVAVHPEFEYVFVDIGQETIILEKSLSVKVLEKAGITDSKIIKEVVGKHLSELVYRHPFGIIPHGRVVTADYVTKEDGTGLVHTAPGHGQEDFQTGLKYNLPVLMPVNDRGVYTKDGGKFEGQHVLKANEEIIKDLQAQGILLARENINHTYPHCWRCKNPIIFRATKQWFLKVDHDHLRDKIKDAIKTEVRWIPEAGQERILGMINTRPDWCLSRQRFWGVPIPAVRCSGCEEHSLFPQVTDALANIVRKEGSNAWFTRDLKDILPENIKCPKCGKDSFEKTFDILDVWFDSGVSHQAVVKGMLNKDLPAEMYLEGSDQHRGWFQSSIIPAVAMEGKPPFANVLTHGFVVDGQGRKMSKSLGNVVSPQDVIKDSGADILRLWVASSSYNEDVRVSKEILDRLIDAYRKIRNTFRYLLSNLSGFDPNQNMVAYKDLLDLDKWALMQLAEALDKTKAAYEDYNFAESYKTIYGFCNEELSSFYLDILKDRLYTSPANSQERRSAQTVLYHIVNTLVRACAPLISFTADEIFAAMPKEKSLSGVESVHLLNWSTVPAEWKNTDILEKFKLLVALRPYVLKALDEKRKAGVIGGSLEAKVIFETASPRDLEYLTKNKDILTAAFIVSQVEIKNVTATQTPIGEEFNKTQVVIQTADGEKCSRCWNYKTDVGADKEHPTLCARCTKIVKEF